MLLLEPSILLVNHVNTVFEPCDVVLKILCLLVNLQIQLAEFLILKFLGFYLLFQFAPVDFSLLDHLFVHNFHVTDFLAKLNEFLVRNHANSETLGLFNWRFDSVLVFLSLYNEFVAQLASRVFKLVLQEFSFQAKFVRVFLVLFPQLLQLIFVMQVFTECLLLHLLQFFLHKF